MSEWVSGVGSGQVLKGGWSAQEGMICGVKVMMIV